MKRLAMMAVLLLSLTVIGIGQDTPAGTPAPADPNALHGMIPVSLAKSIDSKKLKEGDEVSTKTVAAMHAGNGSMIPSGTKVVGHVTHATARSKGDPESSLAMVFDKVLMPGGKDMPMKGVIQAVGPDPNAGSGPDTGAAGSGAMAGHSDPTTMASPISTPGGPVGQQSGQAGGKILNAQSTGVVGIKNLQLENSVLTSPGKEVKLDMGAQILIKAE